MASLTIFRILLTTACFSIALNSATYFEGLDDAILHKIDWGGPLIAAEQDEALQGLESIQMQTTRKERYHCFLPKLQENATEEAKPYTGPSPLELLSSLYSQFICTFKLETYWTYELCHGKYIRQYHEEREGKKVKLQEYYLGRWDKEGLQKAKMQLEADYSHPDYKTRIPTKRVEGITKPALQLNMSDGTHCELNGLPRATRILYVCDPRGKHEIHSLEEVSTCEYEIAVLSPLLCQHPDFKSKDVGESLIRCHALEDAPIQPKALSDLEEESMKMRHEHLLQNLESLLETKIKSDGFVKQSDFLGSSEDEAMRPLKYAVGDTSFLHGFFSGKECLNGGSHWWRVEFCFGKHVLQYHEETPGAKSRTEIVLGRWDSRLHQDWSDRNPQKKPSISSNKKTVYHFYGGGDSCDATGAPRSVEVKFRCVDHPSPSAVTLYLLEPKTCEYTLSVESSLFCPILRTADEWGIFDTSQYQIRAAKSKLKTKKGSASGAEDGGGDGVIILADEEG